MCTSSSLGLYAKTPGVDFALRTELALRTTT